MPSERDSGGRAPAGNIQPSRQALTLLFGPGERPRSADLESVFGADGPGASSARISARVEAEGWAELLASGLTFDVNGLVPGQPCVPCGHDHLFGLPADMSGFAMEGVSLAPGAHIAAGRAMLPVVRALVGLAANMTMQLPVKVVCWGPAGSWMDARYFSRQALNWLSGGVFPALGLTVITRRRDGLFASEGLDFFVGQELLIEQGAQEVPAETVKLGVRIIDHIVREGPIDRAQALPAALGHGVTLEPSGDGREVRVRRPA